MMELEEEVNRVIAEFRSAIMHIVERAAIAALQAAFADSSHADDARATAPAAAALGAGRDRHETAPPPPRARHPAPTDAAALVGRIVACLNSHPGATVVQLAPHVGVHGTTLRRHLHRLAHDGLIRIEERPSGWFGGQPTRAYFVIDRAEAAPPEPNITHAEAA